jgi:hypothetical protein
MSKHTTVQDLDVEATIQVSYGGTASLRKSFICPLRCPLVHGLRVLSEGSGVGASAAASWAAHSYRLEYHDVAEGIGGVGAVSRSGVGAAADTVHALASLRGC